MHYTIIYEAVTGKIVSAVRDVEGASDEHNAAEHQKLQNSHGTLPGMAILEVDDLPTGATKMRDCSVVEGVLVVTPGASAANAKRAAKRAAKKTAKSDARLAALDDMTEKDFMDLTNAQKWGLVFTFMKASMSDD